MLDEIAGRELVEQYLASPTGPCGAIECVVVEEYTERYEGCFVFYWVSKEYWLTKNPLHKLGGNYPILIDASDGTLYHTGRIDADYYVNLFHSNRSQLQRITAPLK